MHPAAADLIHNRAFKARRGLVFAELAFVLGRFFFFANMLIPMWVKYTYSHVG